MLRVSLQHPVGRRDPRGNYTTRRVERESSGEDSTSGASVLIIGGEAEGASEEAQRLAQKRVYIPMPGGAESLNAAVAASIILFEAVKAERTATHHC